MFISLELQGAAHRFAEQAPREILGFPHQVPFSTLKEQLVGTGFMSGEVFDQCKFRFFSQHGRPPILRVTPSSGALTEGDFNPQSNTPYSATMWRAKLATPGPPVTEVVALSDLPAEVISLAQLTEGYKIPNARPQWQLRAIAKGGCLQMADEEKDVCTLIESAERGDYADGKALPALGDVAFEIGTNDVVSIVVCPLFSFLFFHTASSYKFTTHCVVVASCIYVVCQFILSGQLPVLWTHKAV